MAAESCFESHYVSLPLRLKGQNPQLLQTLFELQY
jgi:hypothetical protein